MSRASLHTLVVPTYNRPALLARLLQYLARCAAGTRVLVLDSSEREAQAQNASAAGALRNARHVAFGPTIDPYEKMRDGMGLVETPYCSLCADDDLVVPSAVERCVEALERDRSAALAHGLYFNFNETPAFELASIVYRGASIADEQPLARLRTLFRRYEAVIYGVYRSSVARRVFRDVATLDSVLARELLTGAMTTVLGKCLRVPHFYYGRNTGESLSYSGWHPHEILAQRPEWLFTTYRPFRNLVLEALRETGDDTDPVTAEHVLDLVMLRYLELPADLIDYVIDLKMQRRQPREIVKRVWDVFVRGGRMPRPLAPLVDTARGYMPDVYGAARPHDYGFESRDPHGAPREYRVFHEFLYPELRAPAAAGRRQLLALLALLDSY